MDSTDKMIFYRGDFVDLKVLEEKDIYESNWLGWFNNEQLCNGNGHHFYPNTVEKQKKVLDSLNSEDKIQFGIINKEIPNEICGVISLQKIDSLKTFMRLQKFQFNVVIISRRSYCLVKFR